ncbi:MAG: RNA methyltransferase [Thermoguttaceae bacterium]|nr:RNA methyltransferase [Thermoguttaceae bacterium]
MSDATAREICVDNLDDPRLRPYRNLRERTLRGESIFVAEGALVVERLLRSRFGVESILTTRKETGLGDCLSLVPADVPVYRVDERAAANELVGFEFHQGILAVGKRAPIPTFLEGLDATFGGENGKNDENSENSETGETATVGEAAQTGETGNGTRFLSRRGGAFVVLPDATKPDNLGLAFRCAAALGAEAVVLGERCCDPFSRRALRVSMGGVLQTPIFRAENLLDEIAEARRRRGVRFFATVLNDEAASLPEIDAWPERTAFVFGNEYSGLTPEFVAACDRSVMIPMRPDVDSLNLGVSVGVFLYEFNRARSRRSANG